MSEKGKKVVLTLEDELFIRSNYKTMLNKDLAERFGIVPKSMLRILKRLGITRTKEEIAAVVKLRDTSKGNGREKLLKIAEWHKKQWRKHNGDIPDDSVLMYATKNYESWEDLVLVKKTKAEAFISKRELSIERTQRKIAEEEKKKKIEFKKERKEKRALRVAHEDKKEIAHEKFKDTLVQRTFEEDANYEKSLGKVSVRIDDRTVIWAKPERCGQNEDGSYFLLKTKIKPYNNHEERRQYIKPAYGKKKRN